MSEKIDKAVMKLLAKVKEKKELLAKSKKRPRWKTNCSFLTSAGQHVNIQTIRNLDVLVVMFADLMTVEEKRTKAAEILGVEYDRTYDNYPVSEWMDDFKTRVGMLTLEEQKKEIDILDKRINKLVSPDQRREMELLELEQLLEE